MRSSTSPFVFFIVLFLTFPGMMLANPQRFSFTFQKDRLTFYSADNYVHLRYPGMELTRKSGAPQVPFKLASIALPPGMEIASVRVAAAESDTLAGNYLLIPAQPPQVLSNPRVQFVPPDQKRYGTTAPYPGKLVDFTRGGNFSGYGMAALQIYPVQYLPLQQKVVVYSRIEVEVELQPARFTGISTRRNPLSPAIYEQMLKRLVKNPASVQRMLPPPSRESTLLPAGVHPYVIITADYMVNSFQPLAQWKTEKGLAAKIVTTSWIYANYPGVDSQEKIRNFIKDAYQHWGTTWVLLGGDTNILPERLAYAFDCEYGDPNDNYIPCDLYFADLDGTWNADGDNIYGEVTDSVDMYPEVFVGRAPVQNTTEATAFVNKLLTYEKNAPAGHELNMLYLAEILWNNPYTNSGDGKDYIDEQFVPSRYDPITKLYEALGNENYTTVMNALNEGQNIINHDGHAWYTVMSVGTGMLSRSDMDILTNGPKYSLLFSIGCWPAAFDHDCIAEHFVTNPNGGGVAFIGNSRYGWGSPGNPLFGYSDRFDQQFYRMLFTENIYRAGDALLAAKTVYMPFAQQENVYRWCEYEINLLGDPEMPVWTDAPQPLVVDCPAEVPVGNNLCQITVSNGGSPVENALVCLMQDTTVYVTALTNISGQVNLSFFTDDPSHDLLLTVTAPNCIPYQATISMQGNAPYARIANFSTNGSPEGYFTPGETTTLDVCFKNFGNEPAQDVNAVLSCDDPNLVLMDTVEAIGDLQPGDSLIIANAFSFQSDVNLSNGTVIYLQSRLSDANGNHWNLPLGVTAATPVYSFYHQQSSDSLGGDNDGFPEPGETVSLNVIIQNMGLANGEQVTAAVSSDNPFITFINPSLSFGDVLPSEFRQAFTDVEIDPACPTPAFPQIHLNFQDQNGYQFADSFLIAIGELGFFDNMENGEGTWQHSGTTDLWHLSPSRKHSGTFSWYCGYEGFHQYANNMNNTLEVTSITVGLDASLSFWAWYEFPNYGTDGVYVEVNDGSGWTTLDFLGSGGALGTLNTGNDWLEYTYDLSDYPPGTTLNLRFRFTSDNTDVAEGVYIDDVKLHRHEIENPLGIPEPPEPLITAPQLFQNYPNPFNPVTAISFQLSALSQVKLEIYNTLGQRVRTLINARKAAGSYTVSWDGRNDAGHPLASGVYLYRLKAGNFVQTRKMVLLR